MTKDLEPSRIHHYWVYQGTIIMLFLSIVIKISCCAHVIIVKRLTGHILSRLQLAGKNIWQSGRCFALLCILSYNKVVVC
jgi:hypothetical protein